MKYLFNYLIISYFLNYLNQILKISQIIFKYLDLLYY